MGKKDACGDCIAAYNKLANPEFHALRRLPVAGVFFDLRQAGSTSAGVLGQTVHPASSANTSNGYESLGRLDGALDRSRRQTETVLIAYGQFYQPVHIPAVANYGKRF